MRKRRFVFAKSGDFCGVMGSKSCKLANKAVRMGAVGSGYVLCFHLLLRFVSAIRV
jgi:hypothetical protein